MAIKGLKESEAVSVYSPTLGAFHEVPSEEVRKQLLSFGLTEDEVDAKIKALKGEPK